MLNGAPETQTIQSITPAVNITETSKAYIVSLDIPGAMKEKISANIENNTLVISADIADETAPENSHATKRYFREFSLANDIDLHTIDAHYELGVLRVVLNKKEQYLPKEITIK